MEDRIKIASFRFYAYLNELLPREQRYKPIQVKFKGRQSIKHLIESCGIPHTEVDFILLNSETADLSYIMRGRELISVYPHYYRIPIPETRRLQLERPAKLRFSADGHLGQLARYLRMLGFDTFYKNEIDDGELAGISGKDGRILLTRDRGLLKRKMVEAGCLIRHRDPIDQLRQVVQRYNLMMDCLPFSRCMICNGDLELVKKEDILDLLEPKTKKYFNKFKQCVNCGKVYWAGSHHAYLSRIIEDLEEISNPR